MTDIYIGLLCVTLFSLAVFALFYHILRQSSVAVLTVISALIVCVMFAYGLLWHESIVWARWLPFSNVIVLSNIFPPLLAVIAAVILRHPGEGIWRRRVIVLLLSTVGVIALTKPLFREQPRGGNVVLDGVCMQTTDSSCSPACCVTLLHLHGIRTDESEMIDLCLTGRGGTHTLGIYRGLKLKTSGTSLRVGTISGTVDELLANRHWPAIISVGLPAGAEKNPEIDARYYNDWGWVPGQYHTAVIFGLEDDQHVRIADPSVGWEQWHKEDLELLYNGSGYYLYR